MFQSVFVSDKISGLYPTIHIITTHTHKKQAELAALHSDVHQRIGINYCDMMDQIVMGCSEQKKPVPEEDLLTVRNYYDEMEKSFKNAQLHLSELNKAHDNGTDVEGSIKNDPCRMCFSLDSTRFELTRPHWKIVNWQVYQTLASSYITVLATYDMTLFPERSRTIAQGLALVRKALEAVRDLPLAKTYWKSQQHLVIPSTSFFDDDNDNDNDVLGYEHNALFLKTKAWQTFQKEIICRQMQSYFVLIKGLLLNDEVGEAHEEHNKAMELLSKVINDNSLVDTLKRRSESHEDILFLETCKQVLQQYEELHIVNDQYEESMHFYEQYSQTLYYKQCFDLSEFCLWRRGRLCLFQHHFEKARQVYQQLLHQENKFGQKQNIDACQSNLRAIPNCLEQIEHFEREALSFEQQLW
ncbi:hypothetical protein RFI_18921 [Reticulomyxa filosa]|uniref:Uncharacterized protein n=1 Tax=Reticulomyxa filosa TaxID=46433 RepID=X6MX12_RETFI|nr:hypothetical protein RFI_18921 [Reticulomyxa filosa]|eukprot:ETO18354.1 hypothetical protein RFI_18921 [Reticulomyxa filosa]